MKCEVGEERLFGVFLHMIRCPVDDFIGRDLTAEAFDPADRFSVANIVDRIFMRRGRVILCRQPVVETSVTWLRLLVTVEGCVAVPLAGHAGGVACFLQQLSDSDFFFAKMHLFSGIRFWRVGFRNPVVHAGAIRAASGQQSHARR